MSKTILACTPLLTFHIQADTFRAAHCMLTSALPRMGRNRPNRRTAPHHLTKTKPNSIMGLSIHTLNFFKYTKKIQPFGNMITLGRQGIYLDPKRVARILGAGSDYRHEVFCENVMQKYYGATSVESVDNSGFEHATHIHDMNRPVPESLHDRYDTIYDGGTLEHIYHVPQALKNISDMCKVGGQIIHVIPSNNYCGHGFWQFSPELFFSLYSPANGYAETEIYMAALRNYSEWFKVKEPGLGNRVNIKSNNEVDVIVRTVLKRRDFSHESVQQSDYVYAWDKHAAGSSTGGRRDKGGFQHFIQGIPVINTLNKYAKRARKRVKRELSVRLNRFNPALEVVSVKDMAS